MEKKTIDQAKVHSYIDQLQNQTHEKMMEHLKAFNDGVFAIIITILALEIPVPHSQAAYLVFIKSISIFLISFFASLSSVYEEAAAIDGCPPMKTFWRIMLPLAQPGIVTVGIFNFMNIWNEYFLSLIFASSEKNMSVGPGLKSVLTAMQYTGDWGGLFAAVVIVFLPTLILFLCLSKTIISGITAGGVKG